MRDRAVKPGMRVMAFGLVTGLPMPCVVLGQGNPHDHKRPQEGLLRRSDGVSIRRRASEFKEMFR